MELTRPMAGRTVSRGGTRAGANMRNTMLKMVLWLVSLAYLLTSGVVSVNAFAWLPTLPSAWYVVQRVLYWPFQPYFELMARLLGSPFIPYSTYVLVSWAPIALVSLVLVLVLLGFGRKKKRL